MIESEGKLWVEIYLTSVFLAGLVCIAIVTYRILSRKRFGLPGKVQPWNINWIDFGILISFLLLSTTVFLGTFDFLYRSTGPQPGVEWDLRRIIVTGFALQLGTATALLLYRLSQPALFSKQSARTPAPWAHSLGRALFAFVLTFPVVGLVSFLWLNFLYLLEGFGIAVDTTPQTVVQSFLTVQSPTFLILLAILAVIGAPLVEEIAFRGFFYRFFKARMGTHLAILLNALCFAAFHLELISFLPLFILGVALCLSYEAYGDIRVPIFFHAVFNLNSIIFLTNQADAAPALSLAPSLILINF